MCVACAFVWVLCERERERERERECVYLYVFVYVCVRARFHSMSVGELLKTRIFVLKNLNPVYTPVEV